MQSLKTLRFEFHLAKVWAMPMQKVGWMTTAAIIVAAGRGLRAGGGLAKQWRILAGQPVVAHALAAFAGMTRVLVIHPDDRALAEGVADGALIVQGGADQGSLSATWQTLIDTAAQAQALNRENGVLIETRLQHNQRLLSALAAGVQPSLYGPDGQTRIGGTGRNLGKV